MNVVDMQESAVSLMMQLLKWEIHKPTHTLKSVVQELVHFQGLNAFNNCISKDLSLA